MPEQNGSFPRHGSNPPRPEKTGNDMNSGLSENKRSLPLSYRLIAAQEKERATIAQELHDVVDQIGVLAIQFGEIDRSSSMFDVSRRIQKLQDDLVNIGNNILATSYRLHSSKLEILGLEMASRSFCTELGKQYKVKVDFACPGVGRNVSPEISLCLFRVLQEALRNAVKHSGVRSFVVELTETPSELQLLVRDSGVGFDLNSAMKGPGLGLMSMRERLDSVGGTISMTTKPMGGTEIVARVPR